jgi:hypothetical protein
MYCVVISIGDKIIQVDGPYISQGAAMVDIRKFQALEDKIQWMEEIEITRLIYPLVGPDR